MNEAGNRLFASAVILTVGSGVIYQSCDRASTIYFFEVFPNDLSHVNQMDSVVTLFIEKYQATFFPIILSLFIYLVYWSTERTLIVEEKIIQQKLKLAKSASRLGSRKPSTSYSFATGDTTRRTSFSTYQDDSQAEQAKRLKRLLTAIEEQDTIQKIEENRKIEVPEREAMNKTPPPKFTVERVPELRGASDPIGASRSRLSSFGHRRGSEQSTDFLEDIPKELIDEVVEEAEEYQNPYQRLIELDPKNYVWNLISFSPSSYNEEGWRPMDILSELLAVHLPIWGCVVALYIVLLEMMNIKLGQFFPVKTKIPAYFFYYHGSLFAYGALLTAISCGLIHEIRSNWLTNNILALSSAYVIVSRFQVVSYQTGIIFVFGVVATDLLLFFGVDLITTCLKNKKAPIFIMFPSEFKAKKEVIPTSTFVIPAVFSSVVLKYSSMYDIHLYNYTFYSFISAIAVQILLDIFKQKKIPGLVLPSITAVVSSLIFANHRQDLWRFMIKH